MAENKTNQIALESKELITRKEFLKTLWVKMFRPVIIFICLYITISFLYQALQKGSEENKFVVSIASSLSYILIYGGLLISGLIIFGFIILRIVKFIPADLKLFLIKLSKPFSLAIKICGILFIALILAYDIYNNKFENLIFPGIGLLLQYYFRDREIN